MMLRILSIRSAVAVLAAMAIFAADAAHASSAGYPARPVRLIVPFAPGGLVDVMGRLLAQKLGDQLGQSFIIENRGGGGGNTGVALAQAAAPDGYTILFTSSTFLVNPALQKVPYDPVGGFVPITITSASPNILVINPAQPVKTVAELVALIRQSPEKFSFGSTGFGSPAHLQGEMFKLAYNLDFPHVPFGGGGPALQSTVSGHTPLTFASLPPAVPMVQQGLLRALAVLGPERVKSMPDVPTMAEAGLQGFDTQTSLFALAPAGTPRPIIDTLYAAFAKAIRDPEVLAKMATLGFTPVESTPEQTAQGIKDELAIWAKVAREAKLQLQ
jgi:tripartite-type tricarboxylate transporter receptor subunit TctC